VWRAGCREWNAGTEPRGCGCRAPTQHDCQHFRHPMPGLDITNPGGAGFGCFWETVLNVRSILRLQGRWFSPIRSWWHPRRSTCRVGSVLSQGRGLHVDMNGLPCTGTTKLAHRFHCPDRRSRRRCQGVLARAIQLPSHETGKWSGRRGSNPRHAAWKAGTSQRCGTVLRGTSETCPVIVSPRGGLRPARGRVPYRISSPGETVRRRPPRVVA